jgi:transposase InsO family protein
MGWQEVTVMSQREEFVKFALNPGCNIAKLCRRFEISRKTGYKWIERFLEDGVSALRDRSRKPKNSPGKTNTVMEQAVLELRKQHAAWGGRKIRKRLQNLGWEAVPAASTITAILKRHGGIDAAQWRKHRPWQRFEAPAANDLWQMDFKGHFEADHGRCHPLTVLDDHSRYALGLQACSDQKTPTVKAQLSRILHRYGLPRRLLVDNGSPWGSDELHPYNPLTVWLIRQGIVVIHSGSYHPQTLGKDERFHRSLKAEVGQYCVGLSLVQCQRRFDAWRDVYNFHRPHEALQMQTPVQRYTPSPRAYCDQPAVIEYGADDQVRKVQHGGWLSYRGKGYRVGKAFHGERVAVRPSPTDGVLDVYFCNQRIAQINLAGTKN